MADWSGHDYAEVSGLQRAMITAAVAGLNVEPGECVLDIGCGDGYLTRMIADEVPSGIAVGVDASPRMIATAHAAAAERGSAARFAVADARRLPFTETFDAVVSFNALHWVPEQDQALSQIAAALKPGARATVQMVCAGPRPSLEAVAMDVSRSTTWLPRFDGFEAPFVHVDPDDYGALAAHAGLSLSQLTVTDREWDFGSAEAFARWCAVGTTGWTDRLDTGERDRFVADLVEAYQPIAGRAGLFRFMQMRAELSRSVPSRTVGPS
ncbi:SAM-dependent methyltransferase [Mycolicibacterium arabiense]|uniref:SAM-dependent methyltransferase n=1 Tax=Mycolicibacterium arabiense TaxID=1286181 RepID=A0A7I7RS93_9MYCO|nr:class I SAM-dependent methyltransferase [Mycolicibacterium arabiense]MCV7375904.1 methyltransferase domain-containing protein [Mycolicibacterium arabiense]BBY47432.1 SAM-dependent methyltransferase [Mycolicibacterium arabiense]